MKYLYIFVFVIFGFFGFKNEIFADTANITSFVFTTSTQTIAPGVISEEIKVQTQNGSGEAEPVSETNDVTFTSSSPTGEFLNSSGNAVSKTMSRNTSSRTFFYRDSVVGTFTITVEIKGRDSGTTFTASQDIVIAGQNNSNPTSTSTPTTTTATTTSTTSGTGTSTSSTVYSQSQTLSAHSGTHTITYIVVPPEFKVDAGRHRITTTNSPIEFEAMTSGVNISGTKTAYTWSFGDGTSDTGRIVNHIYKFEGDYNVVLNIEYGGKRAVSRTKVKVVRPEVTIIGIEKGPEGYVELRNNSTYEVNIQNWKIESGNDGSLFPQDTIIEANSSIKFPFDFSTGNQSEVNLMYADGSLANTFGLDINNVAFDEPTKEEIEAAKIMVARQFALQKESSNVRNDIPIKTEVGSSVEEKSSTTESIIDSLEEEPDDESFMASPKKFFNFIKRFIMQ